MSAVSTLQRPEVSFGACPHDGGTMVRRYGEPGVVWRCVKCDYTRRHAQAARGQPVTFWLKACPKCGGDLRLHPDITGTYVACVQCGLELNSAEERLLRGVLVPADPAVAAVTFGPHHQVA